MPALRRTTEIAVYQKGPLQISKGAIHQRDGWKGAGTHFLVLAEIGHSQFQNFKSGHSHTNVNGGGGAQTYIKIVPGRPRHKSPRRPQWLSPQRWGRFFAARRCEIGQSFGVWINLQRGYCNILGIGWAESEARLSIAFDEEAYSLGFGEMREYDTDVLRFTYSSQGPQHIELLQGGRGSIWDGAEHPGVHHIGVWSDDVAGDTRALVEQGWIVRLAQADPEQGYGAFTYVQPPSGLLVELVSSAVRPRFERWFAGGSLG